MYTPTYGYGPGNRNTPSPFNNPPNSAPPPPQHRQQHQQQQQHPYQHPHQQPGHPQHMIYNSQQYAGSPTQGHSQSQSQSQFPGGAGLSIAAGGSAGAIGMIQNNGLSQMASGHIPLYQTPYSSSPYGPSVPTSTATNLTTNFMAPTSSAPSFPMNAMNMNPQHQAQRIQPPPPSSTLTQPSSRASPFAGIPHTTPPDARPQSQFSPPQPPNQAHLQTPNNNQQALTGTIITPQTPSFPTGIQGVNPSQAIAAPLSPGSELREKERVTLLLDINRELLIEVMKIQAEAKKEEIGQDAASPEGGDKEKCEQENAKKEKAEKSKPSSKEYFECMRRLQSNLAYLAAIADRSHKPSSQIPSHPAFMTAPSVTPKPVVLLPIGSLISDTKEEDLDSKKSEDKKPKEEEEEDKNRAGILREQYKKLQVLFPGVDPKNEPQMHGLNTAIRAQAQAQMQTQSQKQGQAQGPGQGQGQGGQGGEGGEGGQGGQGQDPNSQQTLQNDPLRQQLMMQQ